MQLTNLSTLITIPNNILQGDAWKQQVINTGRLVVNTVQLEFWALFDVAEQNGFSKI